MVYMGIKVPGLYRAVNKLSSKCIARRGNPHGRSEHVSEVGRVLADERRKICDCSDGNPMFIKQILPEGSIKPSLDIHR